MAPLHRQTKISTFARFSPFTPHRAWQPLAVSIVALVFGAAAPVHALAPASETWNLIPSSGDWNTAANWTPATVPNSSSATAIFATSTVTSLGISHGTQVDRITYNSGASAFTVTNTQFSFDFDGVGIANNSGLVQNFVAGAFTGGSAFGSGGAFGFNTNASAGVLTQFTANGGVTGNLLSSGGITFLNNSTAGSAVFAINGGTLAGASGANAAFFNSSTAGNSTFNVNGGTAASTTGGTVRFFDTTTAGSSHFTNNGGTSGSISGPIAGGSTIFDDTATAGSGTFTTNGGTSSGKGGTLEFRTSSNAGDATFTTNGGTGTFGASGGSLAFYDHATAAHGQFTTNGSPAAFVGAGTTSFFNDSSAGNGFFITNGPVVAVPSASAAFSPAAAITASSTTITIGFRGAAGGTTSFRDRATAGTGTFITNGGGTTSFRETSTAGGGMFTTNGGTTSGAFGGATSFFDNSTAGNGKFTANGGTAGANPGGYHTGGGSMIFHGQASAGAATFTMNGGTASGADGGATDFNDSATASNGNFTTNGASVGGAGSGRLLFFNSSTAGRGTFTTNGGLAAGANGGATNFLESATAGSGSFMTNGSTVTDAFGGAVYFSGNTAGNATFITNGGVASARSEGVVNFFDSTAANATFTNNGGTVAGGRGGLTEFTYSSTAGSARLTNKGATFSGASGGGTSFLNDTTAGNGVFMNLGGMAINAGGGTTEFLSTSTAGSATITNNAGTVSGAGGGETNFRNSSSAGSATLIATAGGVGTVNAVTYEGGGIYFFDDSTGGTARVIVDGNGKLDIAGHNAPGVTVGSIEGTGQVYLGSRNLTVGSNNLSTTFSGVIANGGAGVGSFTKIGTGTLTLTGINTYNGDTTINGGVLAVNGSIASPSTIVNPGGTLGGTGRVAGLVMNSGIVKPGNSPGTLTIGGNYTQFSNGTLQIAIAGALPGQFSVLAVGGKAMLDGTLQLVKENGAVVKAGDRLKILTATSGVSGVFSNTVNPFASGSLLGLSVIYEANDVLLTFTQNTLGTLAAFLGMTLNQTAVARTLDPILADPRVAQVIAFLNGEPLSSIPADLDRLGPEELTSIFHIAKSLANVQAANILRRLEEIRSEAELERGAAGAVNGGGGARGPVGHRGKEIPLAEERRWGMFFTGSGEFTHVGGTTNASGFDLDSGGVTAGVDYRFTDKFAAGISLGYMNTKASLSNGGNVDVDGGRVGAYATYFDRGLYLDAGVSGGPNSYRTRRTTLGNSVSTGGPEGTEVNLLFAAGYDWKIGGLTVGPVTSFQYTNVQLNGFTESGGLAPLSVQTKNADSARSAVGVHATFDSKIGRAILRHEVRAAWQHEFGDTRYSLTSTFATLGGSAFTVAGPETGRESLLVSAGFSILWNDRISTTFFYDGELLRTNYNSNNVSVGFRYRF